MNKGIKVEVENDLFMNAGDVFYSNEILKIFSFRQSLMQIYWWVIV